VNVVVAAWVLLEIYGLELVVDSRAFLFSGQFTEESRAMAWVETNLAQFRRSRLWPAGVHCVGKVVIMSTAGCTAHTAHVDEQAAINWETETWEKSPPPT
jgi:hypothetical protein